MSEDNSMILQEVKDLVEREQIIRDTAFRKEEIPIKVEFTDAEIEEMTEKQVKIAIVLEKEEARKKEFMDEWNDIVKPKKADQKLLLKQIDNGYKYVDMELYAIQDFENNVMNYYDPEGMLRHSRALLPEERQGMLKEN
jgi:hypothetical protein